jgi:hypothetical protein
MHPLFSCCSLIDVSQLIHPLFSFVSGGIQQLDYNKRTVDVSVGMHKLDYNRRTVDFLVGMHQLDYNRRSVEVSVGIHSNLCIPTDTSTDLLL